MMQEITADEAAAIRERYFEIEHSLSGGAKHLVKWIRAQIDAVEDPHEQDDVKELIRSYCNGFYVGPPVISREDAP